MPEAYSLNDADSRTFGDLIQALLTDLHRPDLQQIAPDYIRNAIRYYSRFPFFFNQLDNSDIQPWAASLYIPQGYTIYATALDGNTYIFVALNAGTNGASAPGFDPNIFTPRSVPGEIFQTGDTGTTVDGNITWATVQAWTATTAGALNMYWTQLSTVPTFNQYVCPIDYIAPYRVEITIPSYRYQLGKLTYNALRTYDAIRPSTVTTYPSNYSFYQNQIYLWPYPVGFYPLTLSYYTAPFPPRDLTTSNFWTTTAESMIRAYARARINAEVLRDSEAAQVDMMVAKQEFDSLKSQEISQQQTGGIPADYW